MCVRILAGLLLFVSVVNSINCPPTETTPHRCSCDDIVDSPGKIKMHCPIYNLADIELLSGTRYGSRILKLIVEINGIATLPSLFFQFNNLENLEIYGKSLTSVHRDALYPARDTLLELTFLDTSLHRVPVDAVNRLKKLKSLIIRNSLIGSFNDSLQISSLKSLQLTSNGISTIANDVLTQSLKTLDFGKNKLGSLNGAFRKHLPHLSSIFISENKVSSLYGVLEGTPNLKAIHAEHNRIVTIDDHCLATVPNLERLYLSHNRIREIHDGLNVVHYLRELELGYNRIDTVSEMAFQNSTHLYLLKLNNNRINQLSEGLFDCLRLLHVLDLSDNLLSKMYYLSPPSAAIDQNLEPKTPICDFWKDSSLKILNIRGNDLVCNERDKEILQMLRSKNVVIRGHACRNRERMIVCAL